MLPISPGPQLHAHGNARGLHRLPRPQAGGLLVDLDGSLIPVHLYDLADQPLAAHAHHIGHVRVPHALRDHQRPGHFLYYTSAHLYLLFAVQLPHRTPDYPLNMISDPTACSTDFFTAIMPRPVFPDAPGSGSPPAGRRTDAAQSPVQSEPPGPP